MARSLYWMKFYYEMLDDPKIGKLSDHLFRLWVNLLLIAGEANEGGYLPSEDDIAWRLRPYELDTLQSDMSQLEYAKLIEYKDNRPFITAFAKRQAHSENAKRQQQWRERKRKEAKEKEKKEDIDIDVDKIKNVTPVTVTSVTSRYDNVTDKGGNNNTNNDFEDLPDLEPEHRQRIKKVKSLINSWKGLTGCSIPSDEDKRKEDFTDPAIAILKRTNWNVTEAFNLIQAKRKQMLASEKTPFRLAAVVPYIFADGDAVGATQSGKEWWE